MTQPVANVLVTDGDERAALAVVRSLGAAGYRVTVASRSGHSIAGGSRRCAREIGVPDALTSPDEFIARLGAIVADHGIDILVPVTESSLLPVLARRDLFARTTIPFASLETFERVSDKSAVLAAARELGIQEPTLCEARSSEDLLGHQDGWSRDAYPVVVKSSRSVVSVGAERRKTSVRYAHDAAGLVRIAEELDAGAFPVLLQQRVRGPGIGIFLLRWDGAVRAAFAHRRIREKPPSGGVSVLRESIPVPSDLGLQSARLLEALGFHGVAMVEFKLDERSGEAFLMEINGRFWGSLQLAVDAGVDFPRLLLDAAAGRPAATPPEYRSGVRLRWTLGDLDHLIVRLIRSRSALGLDGAAPGRVRAILSFLSDLLPPVRGEVFRWRDPGPGLREIRAWLGALRGRP